MSVLLNIFIDNKIIFTVFYKAKVFVVFFFTLVYTHVKYMGKYNAVQDTVSVTSHGRDTLLCEEHTGLYSSQSTTCTNNSDLLKQELKESRQIQEKSEKCSWQRSIG